MSETTDAIRARAAEHPNCALCQHLEHILERRYEKSCRQCVQDLERGRA